MNDSIFFVKIPSLSHLCHVILKIPEENIDFHTQVLKCRQLLSLSNNILAAPQIQNKTHIDAIVHVDFYKKKFGLFCHKLNLKPVQASIARNIFVEQCILYTIKFKLSALWNQVGNLLVANSDFLLCHGKLEAVQFDVTVREEEMTVKIKPFLIRIPPAKLENFGICPQALEMFSKDCNYIIPECAINLQWCHILPTMKKGQLVQISHKLPRNSTKNSFLNSFEGLKKYWKIQYGYSLLVAEEDMIYCSVYFKQIDSNLFTYPLICLRNKPIQFMPRCDEQGIIKKFFGDLRLKFSQVCGLPVTFAGKTCAVTNLLSEASKLKAGVPQNVRIVEKKISYQAPSLLQKVPNENVIVTTQTNSNSKDDHDQVVPSSGEVNAIKKKNLLSCFPTTSDGKYIPVFSKKAKQPAQGLGSSSISSNNLKGPKLQNQQKDKVTKKRVLSSFSSKPALNKLSFTETKNSGASSTTKKHKFDDFFSAASSSFKPQPAISGIEPVLKTCKSKKQHRFDKLFKSASTKEKCESPSSKKFKTTFKQPNQSLAPKKKSQFDILFMPASKSK